MIYITEEVQVKGKRGKIHKSCDQTRDNQDRERKDIRSVGLANFKRSIEVFGAY